MMEGGEMEILTAISNADKKCADRIRGLGTGNNTEKAHMEADAILLEVVKRFGFAETAKAFEELPKWYA